MYAAELMSFNINLNMQQLILEFNTDVDPTSCMVQLLTLQNSSVTTTLEDSFTPDTSGNCIATGTSTTTINVQLSTADWIRLQAYPYLATNEMDTFLSLEAGFIQSTDEVSSIAVDALQVTVYTLDTTQPTLTDACLDFDRGSLQLTFDRAIAVQSVDPTEVTLFHNATTNEMLSVTLTGGTISATVLANEFIIIFTEEDLLLLKVSLTDQYSISIAADSLTSTSDISNAALSGFPLTCIIPDLESPMLIEFSIDLNLGNIQLTFQEPVNIASMEYNLSLVYLSSTSDIQASKVYNLSNSMILIMSTADVASMIVDIAISANDLNAIKADTSVCTNLANCYLTVNESSFEDTSGNSVLPSTIMSSSFTEDMTSPVLIAYSIDLDIGLLVLTFDEPILSSSVNLSMVTIHGLNGTISPVSLVEYRFTSADYNTTIFHMFGTDTLNSIKNLATYRPLSLTLTNTAATDTNDNNVEAISLPDGLAAAAFIQDTTPPELLSFDLDLDTERLTLTFSESVRINTVANQIVLQDRPTNPSSAHNILLNGTLSVPPEEAATVITIALHSDDINSIKVDTDLATMVGNTYLVVREGLANDINGNALVGLQTGIQVNNFMADEQRPELVATSLDLNTGIMSLRFNEPVLPGTIRLSEVYITGTAQTSPGGYNLSESTIFTSMPRTNITLRLSEDTLNRIKMDSQVCSEVTNCYIFYTEDSFEDVNSNQVLPPSQAVCVSDFVAEAILELQSFVLNLNDGIIQLNFQEPVNIASMEYNLSLVYLSSSSDIQASKVYNLSNSMILIMSTADVASMIVDIAISANDLNAIKADTSVCTNFANCYLTVNESSFVDTSGNNVLPSTIMSSSFTEDMTSPVLIAYSIDLDIGLLVLTFDEPILSSSVNLSMITIHGLNGTISPVSLVENRFTSADYNTTIFHMFEADTLNSIKNLATYRPLSLTLTNTAATDTNDNNVEAISLPDGLAAADFIQDTTPPELLSFDLDLDTERLTLTFSESVRINTVANQIVLQDRPTNPSSAHNILLNGTLSVPPEEAATVITIALHSDDINSIKVDTDLATMVGNTYLVVREGLANDINGNALVGLQTGIQVNNFMADEQKPELVATSLDLNTGIVSLRFNEPVLPGTIRLSEVYVTGTAQTSPGGYNLSGSTIFTSMPRTNITLRLSEDTLNRIKMDSQVCSKDTNCYIFYTENSFEDVNGNQVSPPSQAVGVLDFIAEAMLELQSFALNLNDGFLTLTFNEDIDISTVNVAQLTIQNSATSTNNSYTLTGTRMLSAATSNIVRIDLNMNDWNALLSNLNLATDGSSTYISFPDTFATSTNGLEVTAISQTDAQQVSMFTVDIRPLQMSLFTIDFNQGLIHLEFNKPILLSSTLFTAAQLHNTDTQTPATVTYTLTGGRISTPTMTSFSLDFYMTVDDVRALNSIQILATSISDTYISYLSNFVTDTSGNQIVPDTIQASAFISDNGPPQLSYFDANVTEEYTVLTLRFLGNVRLVQGGQGSFALQDSSSNAQTILRFIGLDTITPLSLDTLEITLLNDHLTPLEDDEGMGLVANRLYISISTGVATDYFSDQAVIIPSNEATRVRYMCKLST